MRRHLAIEHAEEVEAVVIPETLGWAEREVTGPASDPPEIQSQWVTWKDYYYYDLWQKPGWKPEEFPMYRIRFILTLIRCLAGRPGELLDTYDLRFRAWPFLDTDVSRLFTQTYAQYMGLARWHYVFASRFRSAALKHRWAPVTTRETITYRRAIRAFERVTVRTRLLAWDDRRFYLEHRFRVGDDERAHALVEGLLRGPEGARSPVDVFPVMGLSEPSPPMPPEIQRWREMQN